MGAMNFFFFNISLLHRRVIHAFSFGWLWVHHMIDRGGFHMMDRVHNMMDRLHHMIDRLFYVFKFQYYPKSVAYVIQMRNAWMEWDIEKTISKQPLNSNSLIWAITNQRYSEFVIKRSPSYIVPRPSYDVPRPSYDGPPYPSYDGWGISYDGFLLYHILNTDDNFN